MLDPLTLPSEIIRKQAREQSEASSKSTERFFDFSDKFILWILGFSIGSISLIIVNFEKVYGLLSFNLKALVFFLGSSIFLGLLYRLISFAYLRAMIKSERQLDNWFVDHNVMTVKPEDLTNLSISEITLLLKTSFLKDMQIPLQEKSSDEQYKFDLIKKYNDWCMIARRDFDEAVNHVADAQYHVYGIPKKRTIYLYQIAAGLIKLPEGKRKSKFNLTTTKKTVVSLFCSSLIFFMVAILWLMIVLLLY